VRAAAPARPTVASRLLVVAVAALSLLPPARLAAEWVTYRRVVGPLVETPPQGFDGVRWADAPGGPLATYVLPGGPGRRAGVEAGDRLVAVDFLPVTTAGEALAASASAAGTRLTYSLSRGGRERTADVSISRVPTLVYPLSRALWGAAGWGFGLATLVHILALATVRPMARRSARARRAAWLIGMATAWVAGNLLRIGWVTIAAPAADGAARVAFDALTLVAVAGWIVFPALLLRDRVLARRLRAGRALWALAVPPAVLGVGLAGATVLGHLGPLPPNAFAAPVIFYVCVYVGAAALLSLADGPRPWLRAGHAAVALLAVAGALVAWQIAPASRLAESLGAGWVLTGLQLLSTLPVVLVSADTLRVGSFDLVMARGAGVAALLAVVFAAVVGGDALLVALGARSAVALGGAVVGVLAVSLALAPRVARWARTLGRRPDETAALSAFAERVRDVTAVDALAADAADAIGRAFDPRSAAVFLRHPASGAWVRAAWKPAPPVFDTATLDAVWGALRADGRVWARNDEICEAALPESEADRLRALGVALAVPVADGEGEPVGLFVLARKTRPLAVYSLADVARLRGLAGQVALAAERLRLVEREKALVRQTAEAELVALRAQINPHFLFNALNTVAALIAERPADAEATVENLAGLFRDVLTASGRPTVPLADELRLVRRYLAVEQARFGDALAVTVDAPDDALAREVPAFSVQTLVENAVKHGVERKRGGGRVAVEARVDDSGALVVGVSDTGVGIPALFTGDDAGDPAADRPDGASDRPASPAARSDGGEASADALPAFFGVGLSNVARRIASLAPGGLAIRSSPDGTTATLTLPP